MPDTGVPFSVRPHLDPIIIADKAIESFAITVPLLQFHGIPRSHNSADGSRLDLCLGHDEFLGFDDDVFTEAAFCF
ncbi:hypothetical protein Hypma_011110 [Hypsizygus marmoreus]|uniref:Uncharacterized protein n=1 Tax=Hypsizygus marmoreus TaxID=39966 RepID=A0A369JL06_HYPMA|nr:hypothetical protein Hypma_011110 [Hypsizygus marmoreus]